MAAYTARIREGAAVLTGMLIIAAFYGSAVALVHVWRKLSRNPRNGRNLRYVLVTRQSERLIEGYLLTAQLHRFVNGRFVEIAVFDDGSTDQTGAIADRWSRLAGGIACYAGAEKLEQYLNEHAGDTIRIIALFDQDKEQKRLLPLQW